MKLPKDTRLAYIVTHEAWYWDALRKSGGWEHPNLMVQASAKDGGVAWEFAVEETKIGHVRVAMFDDSWQAFDQMPEFFYALAELGENATLDQVRKALDLLGAVDETERTQPVR